ncbi:carboxymuconolactone decarboxylase family protein [Rhodoplanes sp. TEM]|uniref:Alkyl hydroperoxide reductase AhpD n=1 Tax=Rhodoplanes tepidamans TaxID=200616 RepID=A0ABT5JFI5_RHOTP|nr:MULTISPECIES: carboxymuconolactone decarboxylase family protein [Rhodoplanes]MDC7788458.1 carboxymuconolactone decarboxylase family protein [Rhodoplanes tepidamans]MDC7983603.1 carboxymuconolactone decarboxylase family protein [Rhodoplanes sp. TEM]MDQ0354155.1 alkyl hydroperoxide reductase subunit D [Rhodoplanes tepidamans]
MSLLETLRQELPDYGKDIKLNLGSLLGAGAVPELTAAQRWGSAVAAAIAARQPRLLAAIAAEAAGTTDAATIEAARTAAALMAMTNVYYRAVHMAGDAELARLPAGLRMNALTRHGIAQADFELFGLAASAVKGCEGCTRAHVDGARKHGVPLPAIQAVLRIAAVVHAAATVLDAATAADTPAEGDARPLAVA